MPEKLTKREKQAAKFAKDARAEKKAMAGFRPRKADRLSYVFISRSGQRLGAGSKRKGFLIYVDRRGKKDIATASPTMRRRESLRPDPKLNRRRKTASKKLKMTFHRAHIKKQFTITALKSERGHVDLLRMTRIILRRAASLTRERSSMFQVRMTIHTKTRDWAVTSQMFGMTSAQAGRITSRMVEGISRMIYLEIVSALSPEDLVSVGSTRVVRADNVGIPREEWIKNDDLWEKRSFEDTKIGKVKFALERMAIERQKLRGLRSIAKTKKTKTPKRGKSRKSRH